MATPRPDRGARLAILYQQMAPTRVPVFDALYDLMGDAVRVFYPSRLEGDRDPAWFGAPPRHPHTLLRPRSVSYELRSMRRYVHLNPDIWRELRAFDPTCVGIWNFNPTMLAGWLYAMSSRRAFICGTDGCLRSDRFNTSIHRWIRRRVIPTADACVGTSANSQALFARYGQPPEAYFNCWLVADNDRFGAARGEPKRFDVLFAGQFIERKLPHFFVDVVQRLQVRKPDVSALLLGAGPLRDEVLCRLSTLGVRYEAPGFLGGEAVARAFASARLFLFPSRLDAYGVVANEAMAAGLPVIANEEAGAVGEAVLDGETGVVLPLYAEQWADAAWRLLGDADRYQRMSARAYSRVQQYTPEAAAEGLRRAFLYALNRAGRTA